MSKQIYKGECIFRFKPTGYMKDGPQKVIKKFYKTQIQLALKNANIQASRIEVEVFYED